VRVIYEPGVFNRMKQIVTTTNCKIVRVETSNDEFSELLDDIFVTHIVNPKDFENITTQHPLNNIGHSGYDWSGSYVVYKGVCFQTHHSYQQ
jgi:hypothetical protein